MYRTGEYFAFIPFFSSLKQTFSFFCGTEKHGLFNCVSSPFSAILAHERLAVVGLSSGAQPILSADGASCLSVNGEIYNHRELEKELDENVQFSTDSDCEV